MRRGKVELKRIEDKSSRQVSFSKRRIGLFKKAKELSVLCDVDIALTVVSSGGRLYEFSSGNSMNMTPSSYWRHADSQWNAHEHISEAEGYFPESAASREGSNILQVVQRFIDEKIIEELNKDELFQLEEQLSTILGQTKKMKEQRLMEEIWQQQQPIDIQARYDEEQRMTTRLLELYPQQPYLLSSRNQK